MAVVNRAESAPVGVVAEALDAERAGLLDLAAARFAEVLRGNPRDLHGLWGLARLAQRRGDWTSARMLLAEALAAHPDEEQLAIDMAVVHAELGDMAGGVVVLEGAVAREPGRSTSWLLLGRFLRASGRHGAADRANWQAVSTALGGQRWLDPDSTPPPIREAVMEALADVVSRREALIEASIEPFRSPRDPLPRVRRAVLGYLGREPVVTCSPTQRPTFLHVPDLPCGPFHDPSRLGWASVLRAHWTAIRAEALEVIREGSNVEDFVKPPAGRSMDEYVDGAGPSPAWDAFFFYKRGRRFDANHAACPVTSALLESGDLCRIDAQAPEILFSVLRAGSRIRPHYGVCNARLVLHLPLHVPDGCALNLPGHGSRSAAAGELLLFDDTFLHEAWNRSTQDRTILLMDCWNPDLHEAERDALRQLIETIATIGLARRALDQHQEPHVSGH